jgi:hypothetical protein
MGELLKIGNTTPKYFDLTRANFLNRIKDGEDLYQEPPPVPQQEVVLQDIPERPPKLPSTGKEWTDLLNGKEFTDTDNVRYYINSITYDKEYRSWIIIFVETGKADTPANRESQSVKDILEVASGEDWFRPYIYDFFSTRN